MTMNYLDRKRWADALVSGEYHQATRVLNDGNGRFCCLGVRVDLDGEGWERDDSGVFVPPPEKDEFCDRLSTFPTNNRLARWGLSPEAAANLAELNDSGATFTEIARVIRMGIVTYVSETTEETISHTI